MRRLFFANFDFEHRLGRHPLVNLPDAVSRINAELAAVWAAIADAGDAVWLPGEISSEFFSRLSESGLPEVRPVTHASMIEGSAELCPWGWSSPLRKWARRHRWHIKAPEQPVVEMANSRQLSARLEQEWHVGLPGAAVVRSREEFVTAIVNMQQGCAGWVAKAEFSMSARERILGRQHEVHDPDLLWLNKRLKCDGIVFVEPWVDKLEEAGLQFTIPVDGEPLLEGVTPLLTDAAGRYRGSRFSADSDAEARWRPAVEVGMQAARELQRQAYFGPLGIDAVRYCDAEGRERIRPLQDINARYTMGRLSLGFRRLLQSGEKGSWLHMRWPDDPADAAPRWLETVTSRLPPGVRVIPTTPFIVAGRPTAHGSLVVIALTRETLAAAEETISSAV